MAGSKVEKVMGEFKRGELHSGSKRGPTVKSRAQAIAIGLSEARKAGERVKPKPKGYAKGGTVTGNDTVLARLTPGEFVVRKKAVKKNRRALEKINAQPDRAARAKRVKAFEDLHGEDAY